MPSAPQPLSRCARRLAAARRSPAPETSRATPAKQEVKGRQDRTQAADASAEAHQRARGMPQAAPALAKSKRDSLRNARPQALRAQDRRRRRSASQTSAQLARRGCDDSLQLAGLLVLGRVRRLALARAAARAVPCWPSVARGSRPPPRTPGGSRAARIVADATCRPKAKATSSSWSSNLGDGGDRCAASDPDRDHRQATRGPDGDRDHQRPDQNAVPDRSARSRRCSAPSPASCIPMNVCRSRSR